MKKRCVYPMVLVLIISMICPMVIAAESGASSWAKPEVDEALGLGIVPRELQSDYTSAITRAEFCSLAVTLIEKIARKNIGDYLSEKNISKPQDQFSDTDDEYVLSAAALGIVNGTSANKFTPDAVITRAEASTMLMRLYALFGGGSKVLPYIYDDAYIVPDWARESVYAAYDCGLMRGNTINEFRPAEKFTRETAIVTALRLYKIHNKEITAEPYLYRMSKRSDDGSLLWGYVDKTGEFRIEPKYTFASDWSVKYGIVSDYEGIGSRLVAADIPVFPCKTIDVNGNPAASFNATYYQYPYFTGNMVCLYGGLISPIDAHLIAGIYEGSFPFVNGAVFVSDEIPMVDRVVTRLLLDRNGEVILEKPVTAKNYFYDDEYIISSYDGPYLFNKINKTKISIQQVLDNYNKQYDDELGAYPDSGESVGNKLLFHVRSTEKYGVVKVSETTVVLVLPVEYYEVRLLASGQILGQKNKDSNWILFDENGKQIYSLSKFFILSGYLGLDSFILHSNYYQQLLFDGESKYVYHSSADELTIIDLKGKELAHISGVDLSARYGFVNGLLKVETEQGVRYYNTDGSLVLGEGTIPDAYTQ